MNPPIISKCVLAKRKKGFDLNSVQSASKFKIVGSAEGFENFKKNSGLCPESDLFNDTTIQACKYGRTTFNLLMHPEKGMIWT
jgi:hypothetical protein